MSVLRSTRQRAAIAQSIKNLRADVKKIYIDLAVDAHHFTEEKRFEIRRKIEESEIRARLGSDDAPDVLKGFFDEAPLPSSPAAPSPEEKKLQYEEAARKGLALFLASPIGKAFIPATMTEDNPFLVHFNKVPVPETEKWQKLKQHAAEAGWSLMGNWAAESQGEIERHTSQIQSVDGPRKTYTFVLWCLSLIGMAETYKCRHGGWREKEGRAHERAALNLLPILLHIDSRFFLQQPWVSELLAEWHDRGKEAYVQHAFFGTPQKRRRSDYESLLGLQGRDNRLASFIQWCIEKQGKSQNAAKALVEEHFSIIVGRPKRPGEKPRETAAAAYRTQKAGFDKRLLRLFRYPKSRSSKGKGPRRAKKKSDY